VKARSIDVPAVGLQVDGERSFDLMVSKPKFDPTLRRLATRDLGVAIDLCKDPNFQTCNTNYLNANTCYKLLNIDDNGVSSINFSGDTHCTAFSDADCQVAIAYIDHAEPNLATRGIDDEMRGIECARPDKERSISPRGDSMAPKNKNPRRLQVIASEVASPFSDQIPSGSLERRYFGFALDICLVDSCQYNFHGDADFCYPVVQGVTSMYFSGDMICILYSDANCKDHNPKVINQSNDDLLVAFNGFTLGSFICRRFD
jgi:hypothetical protein